MALKTLLLGGGLYALHKSYHNSQTQHDKTNQLQEKLDRALAEIEGLKQKGFDRSWAGQHVAAAGPPEYGNSGLKEVGRTDKEGMW